MFAFKYKSEGKNSTMDERKNLIDFPVIDSTNQQNTYQDELQEIVEFVRIAKKYGKWWKKILVVAGGIVVAAIAFFYSINARLDSMDARLDSMDKTIDSFKEDTAKELQDMKDTIGALDTKVDNLNDDVNMIKGTLYHTDCYAAKDEFVNVLITLNSDASQKTWDASTIVAIDEKSGVAYSAGDLSNEKLLLNYTTDGCENLFYGQFNENNHWDGQCIINSYKDDELWFITEAVYDDGNLLEYRQVFETEQAVWENGTSSQKAVWVISERECADSVNVGKSISYLCTTNITKKFEIGDANVTDVIGVGQFVEQHLGRVVSYYSGNTTKGVYEDNSGNAYLVKYDDKGKVVLLYQGKFRNGDMNDDEGTSWYIRWENTEYVYYRGRFRNGSRIDNNEIEHIMEYNRLSDLTLGKGFACKLDWYDFTEM